MLRHYYLRRWCYNDESRCFADCFPPVIASHLSGISAHDTRQWRHSAAACCTIYWCRNFTPLLILTPYPKPITPQQLQCCPLLTIIAPAIIAIKFPKQEALAPRSRNRVEHKGENGCCCWRNEKVMQNRHHFYRVRNVGVFHSSLSP